jgi:hypothetical protein
MLEDTGVLASRTVLAGLVWFYNAPTKARSR